MMDRDLDLKNQFNLVARSLTVILVFFFLFLFAGLANSIIIPDYTERLNKIQAQIKNQEFPQAEDAVRAMLKQNPEDAELMSILARLLFWQKKYDEAIEVYKRVLMTEKGGSLQKELESVEVAKAISEAGVLINNKNYIKAENVLSDMAVKYPTNIEILSLRARVLHWQKKYDEALEAYNKILSFADNALIRGEMQKVAAAKSISEADILIEKGDTDNAVALLKSLFESGRDYYDAGYKLGMLYVKKREYDKAIDIFQRLEIMFPEDIGFSELYIESLILNGDIEKAKDELKASTPAVKEHLAKAREDIFYRVRKNNVKLSGSFFGYSNKDRKNESEYAAEISQRINELTFVVSAANIHRYGLSDDQITVTVYSKLGEKTKRGGYLTFSGSPSPNFLPKNTFGGNVYQGYGIFEFSLGYNRMNFDNSSVDIIIPGIIAYLPNGFSLNEALYIVPKNGSYSLVSSLTYEPDHKFRALCSISTGKSAEIIRSLEDIQKLNTFSGKVEAEYRFNPGFSAGATLFYESRELLYDKTGAAVFTKFWW